MHLILKLLNNRTGKAKIAIDMHEVIDPMEGQILPLRLYSRFGGKLLGRGLDAYIVHCSADIDTIARIYGIDQSRIHVIPPGLYDHYGPPIDQETAKKNLGIKERTVLLNFGLIRKYKGVHILIDAFDRLPGELAKNTRLLIVGEIWDRELDIPRRIKSARYSKQITLIDRYIADDEVRSFFSAADIVTLPYLRSSGSAIALIGMAFAKPIIVSRIGALTEFLADYNGAYFIPPDDAAALAAQLQQVISESRRSSTIAPPDLSWDKIALRYKEVFEKIG